MPDILSIVVSTLLAGVVSWFVSRRVAMRQLRKEREIRHEEQVIDWYDASIATATELHDSWDAKINKHHMFEEYFVELRDETSRLISELLSLKSRRPIEADEDFDELFRECVDNWETRSDRVSPEIGQETLQKRSELILRPVEELQKELEDKRPS